MSFISFLFDHPFGIGGIAEHLTEGALRQGRWALRGRVHGFGLFDDEVRYGEWSSSFGLAGGIGRIGFGIWASGYRLEIGDEKGLGIGVGSSISVDSRWIEIHLGKEVPVRRIGWADQPEIGFLSISGEIISGISFLATVELDRGDLRFPIKISADLSRLSEVQVEIDPSLWTISVGFSVGYGPISLSYLWRTHPTLPDTHELGLVLRARGDNASRSPPSGS
jgi:hypothetical protein